MIPKTLFLYWGDEKLSFLRYLTVYSFKKYNKDWKIKIFVPSKLTKINNPWHTGEQKNAYIGENYFDKLNELDVEIIKFNMEIIGFSNNLSEVYKSDILRNWLLYNYGGVYSDSDIIYFKSLNISKDVNTMFCFDGSFVIIGLIGGSKGNKFYKELFDKSKLVKDRNYQSFGRDLWSTSVISKEKAWNIPMSLVYHYDWLNILEIFSRKIENFPTESIGCHWYAGSAIANEWENKITHSNYNYDILICSIIKKVYADVKKIEKYKTIEVRER